MSYVGIDPSLTRTAICILHDDGSVTVREKATTGRADASICARINRINDIVNWAHDVMTQEAGDVGTWAIEGPSIGSKNAAAAHDRSGLWWLLVDAITGSGYFGTPIVVPPTVRAKYATGKGNAGKDEVIASVIRRNPHAPIDNNDQADAYVIAHIAARLAGDPQDDLPATHLAALDKLTQERP